jgi:hypothetical protein
VPKPQAVLPRPHRPSRQERRSQKSSWCRVTRHPLVRGRARLRPPFGSNRVAIPPGFSFSPSTFCYHRRFGNHSWGAKPPWFLGVLLCYLLFAGAHVFWRKWGICTRLHTRKMSHLFCRSAARVAIGREKRLRFQCSRTRRCVHGRGQ